MSFKMNKKRNLDTFTPLFKKSIKGKLLSRFKAHVLVIDLNMNKSNLNVDCAEIYLKWKMCLMLNFDLPYIVDSLSRNSLSPCLWFSLMTFNNPPLWQTTFLSGKNAYERQQWSRPRHNGWGWSPLCPSKSSSLLRFASFCCFTRKLVPGL